MGPGMSLRSPAQARRASPLDFLGLLVLGLLVLVVFLDEPHVLPRSAEALNLSPALLPLYALYSLLRMMAAYALSLAFALVSGYWAAHSAPARRLILTGLDILQSVPILGFFPAAVFFFIRLFQGTAAGVEAAAVFLIFTSQAWNLAFSVYESLTTIPEDVATAVRVSGARGMVRWRRLLLPACLPRLIYNSMLSWAGGWYFLIASEVIAVGRRTYKLPGLGSYIGESIGRGRYGAAAASIATLVAVIIALHVGVWAPLEYWSSRFRYEYSSRSAPEPRPVALDFLARAPLFRHSWIRLLKAAGRLTGALAAALAHIFTHTVSRFALGLGVALGLGLLAWGGVETALMLHRPLPTSAFAIPAALAMSFLRLLTAYAIALAWTLPVAFWISLSPHRAARVLPVVQILASVPATAFFPVIVAGVVSLGLNLNVAAIALVLTGMQWYLLFNLVAGGQAMPGDLRELAAAVGVPPWLYFVRFFLPVAMPSLVTGSLTAWGGGWNALIISESVTAAGKTYSVPGIGTLLDRATYIDGDLQMVTLTILSMVLVIMLLNRAVWRPLYRRVSDKYRLE